MLENLISDSFLVGLRTSVKAIEKGTVEKAYVAADIAPNIYDSFTELCRENGISVEEVPSKAALGKACHIDVPTAVATIVKSA